MGKAEPSHLMFTWDSAKSVANGELDNLSPNYQKVGNSTSKIHDRLKYFHACSSFYYTCEFDQVLNGERPTSSKVTKMGNVFDGGNKDAR